jgi:hypothetical protein
MPIFFIEVWGAASNSAYYGYPTELWILRYPAHRYHAVPSPGFKPTTVWLRVRYPNHLAMMLHITRQNWYEIVRYFYGFI